MSQACAPFWNYIWKEGRRNKGHKCWRGVILILHVLPTSKMNETFSPFSLLDILRISWSATKLHSGWSDVRFDMIAIQQAQFRLERTLSWLNWVENRCNINRKDSTKLLLRKNSRLKKSYVSKNVAHFSFGKRWNHVFEIRKITFLFADEEKSPTGKGKHPKRKINHHVWKKNWLFEFHRWSTWLARVHYTSGESETQNTMRWYMCLQHSI